jgi:uroporphyrinogen decarboxylase
MLTSKERIARILQHQPVDRVGLFEVFWKETAEKWADEGRLEKPEMVSEHFGQDIRRAGGEITPMAWRLVNPVADLDAGDTIVEESDTVKLVRNGNGALLRWRKDGSGAPEHVDFLVKDRRTWQEHVRPRLLNAADFPRRIDFGRYRALRAECARQGTFFCASVVAAFDVVNELCGHQCQLTAMATDPDWIRDMGDVYTGVSIDMLEMLFAREGLPDGLWVWDDLGFKHRPFMSPGMYGELIFPAHKRLFDFAHRHKLPVVLHCDGFVEPLVPQLIAAGIDCLQPVEVKAGMDLLKLKRDFGRRLSFIGGMDARTLVSNDLGRVRRELETKLPLAMAGSGYVLQVDHSVPHQVNYETYKYFVERGLQIGTYN